MDPLTVVELTRRLIDIDSTTGKEGEVSAFLARYLRDLGWDVIEQPLERGCSNVYARLRPDPLVAFSTHFDCVPPFFPSREENGRIYGRGACDAKGILAAQIAAAERLRRDGEDAVSLLFVAGEERGSDGAMSANDLDVTRPFYLVNGEPTDNRLGIATRGVLRLKFTARGRAAHSAYPELGESAIEKMLEALMRLRALIFPEDLLLGRTTYNIGTIQGGVAPNVIPAYCTAEVLFRTVGPLRGIWDNLLTIRDLVDIENVLEVPLVRLEIVPDITTEAFSFTTDVPFLRSWGRPLLIGPGSIHVAHTPDEHIRIDELQEAVELYGKVAIRLMERGVA